MKIKFLIFYILSLSIGSASNAQTYILTGRITDIQSQQQIAGATVQNIGGQSAVADNQGRFRIITGRRSGTLQISAAGYHSKLVEYKNDSSFLNILMEADVQTLNEVRITAFGDGKRLRQTAGGIAYLSRSQIHQGDGTSMQEAMNSVPGVRMDHSHGEDSKISIRGEGIRSPWGNRNIKLYVNDIPLTETDGTSRIEALDVSAIGSAEIIKGPASSLYGGGAGGIIKFYLDRAPYQEQSIEGSVTAGDFGLNRQVVTYRNGGEKMNSYIAVGRQHTEGYREHSRDDRNFVAGNFQWFPSSKRTITMLVNRTTQDALIPGGITEAQVTENPKSAAFEYVDKNAGRDHKWTRIGVGQKYDFDDRLSNSSSIFTYFYDLHHPLPFGIINSTYQSFGGRTRFDYRPDFSVMPTTFTLGGEFTQAFNMGNIYFNNRGTEDGLMSNTDYRNTGYSVFFQSESKIGTITDFTFGISINGLTYRAYDRLKPVRNGSKKFNAQLAPRVALSHHFSKWVSLHGSISLGFTNPASDQIQNPDRSINRNIQAERAVNYELNVKGSSHDSRLGYDLALFILNMRDELIGQSLPFGINVFHNAGKTKHEGAELGVTYRPLKEGDNKFVSSLFLNSALTYSHFKFVDYKILDEKGNTAAKYDGNPLTGIAPWMISSSVNVETIAGLYANLSLFFNDRYTLNDAATDYNPSYTIVNARVGIRKKINERIGINFYGGVQNILNKKYSSFTEINTADNNGAPAYFNPALPINGYLSLSLKYFLTNN